MRAVKRNLQKVPFQAASHTQPKIATVRGDEIVTWNSIPDDKWLNSNATDPMEPFARSEHEEVRYSKRCTCGLIPGEWCNCG